MKSPLLRYWAPVLFIGSLIFYLSSLPQSSLPRFDIPYIDKVAHFILYTLLSFSISRALTYRIRDQIDFNLYRGPLILGILLTTLYGALDEWHQHFTPGRAVEWADLVADFLGAVTGAALAWWYRKIVALWP